MKAQFKTILFLAAILLVFAYTDKISNLNKETITQEIINDFKVDTNEYIVWNIRRKLQLSDFNKIIVPCLRNYEDYVTILSVNPLLLIKVTNNKVLIATTIQKNDLSSYYTSQECKYKIIASENERKIYVRYHEQLHFDIQEILARYERKNFIKYLNVITDSVDACIVLSRNSPEMREIYQKNNEMDEYDKRHTILETYSKYKPWINQKLKELEDYANPVIYFKKDSVETK